ncbi:hypothetical protein RRG08_023519 [Elysia crispata]|uniref:Uncharacterized protein n=1 Tax=Elysia crispata TaxID=231223 RepID=A0AAE0YZJ7_9GAST|nr:hypothetical protein RRG08_023519 [Elysia crispata]
MINFYATTGQLVGASGHALDELDVEIYGTNLSKGESMVAMSNKNKSILDREHDGPHDICDVASGFLCFLMP